MRQQFLLDVAAAVPALVDDQAFLVAELAQLLLELGQRRLVHRLDVQVADPAARELVDHRATLLDPPLVSQVAEGRHRDRLVLDLPGALGGGLVVDRQLDLAIEPAAEERVVVVAGLDGLAVDGDQVIPLGDLDPVLVGRAVLVDMGDLVASARGIRLEVQAEVAGRAPAPPRRARGPAAGRRRRPCARRSARRSSR